MRARVLPAGGGEEVVALTRQALESSPPVIVAAGGDGTMSAVASAVRGTRTALGVLPVGTMNHFAKDLRVPLERAAAIRVIAEGHRAAIDVGEVNGHAFLNNSSLGLYPDLVRHRRRRERRLRHSRRTAMLWTLLAGMRRAPLLNLRLGLDEREHECRAPFIFIGNNEYEMQGFSIGTRSRLDEGWLSVYTTTRSTFGGLLLLALRALFGRLHQAEDFSMHRARELSVESHRPRLLVATDGEIRMLDTPLRYLIVPRSLTVLVPAPSAGS